MEQINYEAFRPMDIVFYSESSFLHGKQRNVGIVISLFEDLYIIEVTNKGLSLRHIEEIEIENARRAWIFDGGNTTYVAQSIVMNDYGRELMGKKDSQYAIARCMNKTNCIGQYIYLILSLSGFSFNGKFATTGVSYSDMLSDEFGLSRVYLQKDV